MGHARSLVAGANALFRAAESRRAPDARILHDPFAHLFAESDPRVLAIRYGRFLALPLWAQIDALQTVHCVRHRAVDELILRAIAGGARQVVVAGAGYDMRPARFADRLDGVRWIEADHPATAARKWRILAARGGVQRPVEHTGVDLDVDSLGGALERTRFDPALPTCFVLEGLVHYLAPERLDALLADAARGPGPRVVLITFIRTDMYESAPGLFVKIVQAVREVPRLHFTTEGLAARCAQHGLGGFQSWRLAEQIAEFAPVARGRRAGVSQDVARVERG